MHRAVFVVIILLGAAPALGQSFVNGSLTGPAGYSVLPIGWAQLFPDCDTEDAAGPHEAYNLSPDGGSFVAGTQTVTVNPVGTEAFQQTVSGLIPFAEYTVTFYQSNLGFGVSNVGGSWSAIANWQLYIDGEGSGLYSAEMAPTTGALPNNLWSAGSITFTVVASEHALGFGPHSVNGLNAFLGIDGIVLSPATATEPATLSRIKSLY